MATAEGDIVTTKGEIDFLIGENQRLPIDVDSAKQQLEH